MNAIVYKMSKKHLKSNIAYFNRFKKDDPWKDTSLKKYGYDDSIMVERDEPFDAEKELAMQYLQRARFLFELHNMNG